MIRRTATLLSQKAGGRTVVRDPRKKRVPAVASQNHNNTPVEHNAMPQQRQAMPFEPSQENQQSVGSSMFSYMLAGAGMAIGFTIVGAIFGG